MIDLRPMSRVRVDPEDKVAWCGGGAQWVSSTATRRPFGLAVTGMNSARHGRRRSHAPGGGSGWIERKYGFTVDSPPSAEVVTADGPLDGRKPLTATWIRPGAKGGGGNFRVAPGFEFRLHDVGPLVDGGIDHVPDRLLAVHLLKAYRAVHGGRFPRDLHRVGHPVRRPPRTLFRQAVRGKPVLAVIGRHVGPVDAGERAFAPRREWIPALDMFGADAVHAPCRP